jgi:hypothetical protein
MRLASSRSAAAAEAMTVWNLGPINIDHVYRVPRLPPPFR